MLRKGFLRHKTPENIIRKDVEFSTPFPLFSIGLIYSWRVAPQQSSFTLQSNKAKISNLNYIYNLSKLVTTYHPTLITLVKHRLNFSTWVCTRYMEMAFSSTPKISGEPLILASIHFVNTCFN